MLWPAWEPRRQQLIQTLAHHAQVTQALPGIQSAVRRDVLSTQLIASLRRERYFEAIQAIGPIGAHRADPNHPSFEAELGVVHLLQTNQIDEAGWLIFLMTFFAKPFPQGWSLLRQVYGKLGAGRWDWATVAANPAAFKAWQIANWPNLNGQFGSHRQYESLKPDADRPMWLAVEQYVALVAAAGGHRSWLAKSVHDAGNDPHKIFDHMYKLLNIRGFGRLGRFDYVSMLDRYGLIPAKPGKAYFEGATGPKRGARLLFGGNTGANIGPTQLQQRLDQLDEDLHVGMNVLEDALCNWQKDPDIFVHFRG
jgi:hypothetical protein